MAAKEDPKTVTILIANHKDWTTQTLPLTTKPDVHVMTTIPPHTITYKPTPEWPTYYQYDEPALTSIICVHNQSSLSPNVQTPHTLKQLLQQLTNTHINTHPITPNLTHYKVKLSNIWKDTPTVNMLHTNNHITIPLPNTYTHMHPPKFPPQQCIYTGGSFIPPTKNSEGQIVGNTAGAGVYSPNNDTRIAKRLPGYQNILRAELYAIFLAIKNIKTTQTDTHIFTDSLNSIYLINNHIQHPTSPPGQITHSRHSKENLLDPPQNLHT